MQCYTELTPPTCVKHSLALPLLSAQSNNLVVAKGSLLQIFTTKTISAEVDNSQTQELQPTKQSNQYDRRLNDDDGLESSFLGGEAIQRADRTTLTKLVLIAEYPVSGWVTGLARVKVQNSKSGGEALLIASRDAKLSLAQWDPEKHELENISIHYYEKDELRGAPFDGPLSDYPNYLAADPGSRCAALKFGARYVAILPFKQSDEDMDMGDWDEDIDGPRPVKEPPGAVATNGTSNHVADTPFSSSFVLPLPSLDPTLLHTVHLAFLHEYREPTFGVISSTQRRSNTLGRKDHFFYKVFTLDLQQRASTTILSVNNLPQDLFRVVALPGPIGGALLVGSNELIHIDQSGKPNGVAVNPFTKDTTNFPLADQSDLGLRLEHCVIDQISAETGELLMVLNDGRLAVISFKIDGRTVSGISIKMVSSDCGGSVVLSTASCISKIGRNSFFIGSQVGDSLVVGWTRKQAQATRRKSRLADLSLEYELEDEDLDEDDEDDLYGEGTATIQALGAANGAGKGGDITFRIHDSLLSLAPIRDLTCGKAAFLPESEEEKNSAGVVADMQLACAVGRGNAGALAILNRDIQPKVIGRFEFPEARGFWTMCVHKPVPKALQGDKGANAAVGNDYDTAAQYDKFMIVSKVDLDGYETSDVYALTAAGFEALAGTEFDPAAGFTVEAGTMGKHMRLIQVLKSEVRCYDGDLGLSQILPMLDEETGAEPRVISASIADPYLLLIRDDSSILVAEIDSNNELEELEKEDDTILATKWLTGCLYVDTRGLFATVQTDKGTSDGDNIFMFLLSATGALYIYALPNLSKPVYVAQNLCYVPPFLSPDYAVRRGTARETITEILVSDLGDMTFTSPYLILRHANDDITLYEPLRLQPEDQAAGLGKSLHFQKIPNAALASTAEVTMSDDASQQPRFIPLRSCSNVGGYSTVFLPAATPSFIIKSSKSTPKIVGLQGLGVRGMSPFHTEGCARGFIYADSEGCARVTQLPLDTSFAELGMSVKKVPLGDAIALVAFHPPMETYAVACSVVEPFELPKDDDYHKEWAKENTTFLPMVERGVIKLVSPVTWTVIDTVELEPCEVAMCMKTLLLEVSEETKERRMLITIGTAINKGEDLPIRGRIYVYDVVSVIPQPNRPETNKKLKLVAKEEIPRGAVTAVCEVGSQGLMLVAQGQKCMVRGLKEDGTLLPVAFMDMSCYVTAVREVRGTGYCLMADAFKGVWFVGYSEEPYKMTLFGKSAGRLDLLTADFLVDGDELNIVVCDKDGTIHVLQFDPEHPKSLQGHLLILRASFATGPNSPTSTLPLPRTLTASQHDSLQPAAPSNNDPQLLLLASASGQLAALTPLSEAVYRRLISVTNGLINALPHVAGMNPKAYRLPPQDARLPAVDASSGRTVVDGALLARWNELGAGRRAEIAGKGGYGDSEAVRAELQGVLGWGGTAYF